MLQPDELINVLHTNRKGEQKIIQMKLRHYLQANAVRPKQFQPGDKEAERLIKDIPLDKVPRGTTQEDVKAFEKIKGTIKTDKKKADVFEDIFATLKQGKKEVEEVPEAKEDKPSYTAEELESMTHDQIDAVADSVGAEEVKQLKTKKEKAKLLAELLTQTEIV
jgi:hypothetical protein